MNLSWIYITICYSKRRRRQWHPTPVLLPGKSHEWRSLVGCSPWGRRGSGTTEWLHFHFSLSCTGEGNDNPLQCSCLENPRDGGAWWAAIYGVTQSRTRLKRLSSIVKDQPIDQTPKSSTPQVRASISAIQMCPMDRWWSGYFYQSTVIWIQKLVMNMTRHITIWYWHATQAHNQCIIQTY